MKHYNKKEDNTTAEHEIIKAVFKGEIWMAVKKTHTKKYF